MTEYSARLAMPLLAAGQAQKEIWHNEALAMVDLLLQGAVEDHGVEILQVRRLRGSTGSWARPRRGRGREWRIRSLAGPAAAGVSFNRAPGWRSGMSRAAIASATTEATGSRASRRLSRSKSPGTRWVAGGSRRFRIRPEEPLSTAKREPRWRPLLPQCERMG